MSTFSETSCQVDETHTRPGEKSGPARCAIGRHEEAEGSLVTRSVGIRDDVLYLMQDGRATCFRGDHLL